MQGRAGAAHGAGGRGRPRDARGVSREAPSRRPCVLRSSRIWWPVSCGAVGGGSGADAGGGPAAAAAAAAAATTVLAPAALAAGGRVARSEELSRIQRRLEQAGSSRRRASVNVAKLLTGQIAAASTLEQIHDIVASSGSSLDHIHVAKLLSRVSHVVSRGSAAAAAEQQQQPLPQPAADQQQLLADAQRAQQEQLLCNSLSSMMVQRLRHTTPQSLVVAVAALGRLAAAAKQAPVPAAATGGAPAVLSAQQLQQLAARVQQLAGEMSVSQLAVVLWGMAKLGLQPSGGWLEAVLGGYFDQYERQQRQQQQQEDSRREQEEERRRREEELQRQQQQQQAAAAASPGQRRLQRPALPAQQRAPPPSPPPQQQYREQLQEQPAAAAAAVLHAAPHYHSLATDLALSLYALASMGAPPPGAWVDRWRAALLEQLPSANAQDVSQALWGLASLGIDPEPPLLDGVAAASLPLLAGAGSKALTNTIWALARLGAQPSDEWVDAFCEAFAEDAEAASNPLALSCCLASLARLRAPVQPAWMAAVLDSSEQHLASFAPPQLAGTCWALATLGHEPPAPWLRAFLRMCAAQADAGRFAPAQLGRVVWSLAVLRRSAQPLPASQQLQVRILLEALAAGGGRGLAALGPGGRSGLMWAVASLGVHPGAPWLRSYLAAAFAGGLASDQLRCANVLFCAASVDFDVLVEWLGEFLEGGGGAAAGGGGGGGGGAALDLSLEKYAALAGVLGALGDMDARQLRTAWLELSSSSEWLPEAVAGEGGPADFAMQLPPQLASWVDGWVAGGAGGRR